MSGRAQKSQVHQVASSSLDSVASTALRASGVSWARVWALAVAVII